VIYDISAFLIFDEIQATAMLATVLFYGIHHEQPQADATSTFGYFWHRRRSCAKFLHFGDDNTFSLNWKESVLGYGTSTAQIITLFVSVANRFYYSSLN